MGIKATLSNFKSFTFNGVNSRTYGVYITGKGVYNAPERNVEMVEIPGRNGSYALDKGNFNNIEVTYEAAIFADTQADYADAMSDLRNFLCSQTGYVRLEDDYNPNEYRLAVYKSGLETDPFLSKMGKFELVFDCKPQRFLTSGETAVSVASGGTLTNPTLFDSHPLLEVSGYGGININGQSLSINGGAIGDIVVGGVPEYFGPYYEVPISDEFANTGDNIKFDPVYTSYYWIANVQSGLSVQSVSVNSVSGSGTAPQPSAVAPLVFVFKPDWTNFKYGTSATKTLSASYTVTYTNSTTASVSLSVSASYDGASTFTITPTQTMPASLSERSYYYNWSEVVLTSSQSALGNPLYFDLDIGEAYKIENGTAVSVNNAVTIPSELPVLASGSNTITYDNTFTQFKVVPRWWKV